MKKIVTFTLFFVLIPFIAYADTEADFKKLENEVETHLKKSSALRNMDEQLLAKVAKDICDNDIETENDDEFDAAKKIVDEMQKKVKTEYDKLVREKEDYIKRLKPFEDDCHYELIAKKMIENLKKDQNVLDNIKNGLVQGANNPSIRAKMRYGQDMHRKMQASSTYACNYKEYKAGGGSADCVSFKHCKVFEFKPSGYSDSKAKSQAEKYVKDVNDDFKKDPKAANCYPNGFKAEVESYTACK